MRLKEGEGRMGNFRDDAKSSISTCFPRLRAFIFYHLRWGLSVVSFFCVCVCVALKMQTTPEPLQQQKQQQQQQQQLEDKQSIPLPTGKQLPQLFEHDTYSPSPPPPPKHLDTPHESCPSLNESTASLPIPGRHPSPRSPTPSQTPGGSTRSSSVLDVGTGDQLLDHSHLKPGSKASLLSYNQTINMYRENAKKTNSPDIQCDFAIFMVEAAKPLAEDDESRWEYLNEAEKLLKQLASRGHAESQYYLGNLYAAGLLSRKGKNEFDKAFPLFVQATKHHHADAAYR